MARGTRKKIDTGIYKDAIGIAAKRQIGPRDHALTREIRFPAETPLKEIKAWQDEARVSPRAMLPTNAAGPFADDLRRYVKRVKPNHIGARAFRQREGEINAWLARFSSRGAGRRSPSS